MYTYRTKGVCSRAINVEVEGDTIKHVDFIGGCNGNLQGISALVKGMKAEEAIARLKGINCGGRGTSCPDQFARGLEAAMAQK